MRPIDQEIARLQQALVRLDCPLARQQRGSQEEIAHISSVTGMDLPEDLLELWRYSNGSGGQFWFLLGEIDEDVDSLIPLAFESIGDALKFWSLFGPYDQAIYDEWFDNEEWGERDHRIQRHFLRHKAWLPFAELNGGPYHLQVDNDPTPLGKKGQIIYYVHDPDGVFWVADDFLSFFSNSNSVMEHWLEEDKEALAEALWLR